MTKQRLFRNTNQSLMPSMPKLSLVIAMYNIERYIAHCLESCIHQEGVRHEDYEILVINDGSTDNSLKIAQDIIGDISNARIVTRVNGGLSEARNTGLREAKGEYVWFIDGDDAIADDAVSIILAHAEDGRNDAFVMNFSTFDGEGIIQTSDFSLDFLPLSGEEIHYKQNKILPLMAWLSVYRTDFLKNNTLSFLPGIVHEDFEFSIRAHHLSASIGWIFESLYHYRVARTDSIMSDSRKDNTKSLESEIKIIESFKSFFMGVDNAFVRRLFGICATSFLIRRYDSGFVDNDVTAALIRDNKKSLYRYMWNSRQWKRRLLLIFIVISPSCVVGKVLHTIGERSKLM